VTALRVVAERMDRVAPRLYHWTITDDDHGRRDSFAVDSGRGVLFIDPLPMRHAAAERFPAVAGIYLTTTRHERACWRYRLEHGGRIWAPLNGVGLTSEPDRWYTEATKMFGGFEPIRTPGTEPNHYVLFRPGDPSILFAGDLAVRRDAASPLELPRPMRQYNEAFVRRSLERILDLEFDLLCLSHGGLVAEEPKDAIRELLERTA
jgi:glyoxylase-like metal-dependent hydrolase (beta-lactamase superfamily II)